MSRRGRAADCRERRRASVGGRASASEDGPVHDGRKRTEDGLRESERALRESEARHARLAATVPGVLYEFARHPDGSGRFTYLSARCPELFEIDGRSIVDDVDVLYRMMHPDDRRALTAASIRAGRERAAFSMEVRITTPSGRAKWIQFTSCPASTSAEGVEIRSGLMLDVTERKRIEDALRESEEWLKLTVEATGAGIINTVPFGPPALSPRYRALLGIPDDLAIDGFESFLRLVHPDDREAVRRRTLAAGPEDVQRALEAGFDAHVPKPFDLEHLEHLLSRG